jgi:serine/threonine protein kinase
MPVEQIDGKEADARSDLYSLCVVLYEMLAGELPFRGDTYTMLIKNITSGNCAPLRRLNRSVPRDVEALVHKGLEAKSGDRFPDAATLSASLHRLRPDREVLPAQTVSQWLNSPIGKAGPRKKSSRRVPLLLLTLAAVGILAVIYQQQVMRPRASTGPHAAPMAVIQPPIPVRGPDSIALLRSAAAAPETIATPVKMAFVHAVPKSQRRPSPAPFSVPVSGSVLDQGKACFEKSDYFNAERLFNQAVKDTSGGPEASYYLVRILDSRFRAGQAELREDLKTRWQTFIRDNAGCKSCSALVKDAKERLLYVIRH